MGPRGTYSASYWLGADGPIARRRSGYQARRECVAVARAVAQALREHRHLAIEADRGPEERIAYLLPAVLHVASGAPRLVVSAQTPAVRDQILNKDLPLLNAVIPREFTAVQVNRRGDYLCLRRLARVMSHADSVFTDPDMGARLDRVVERSHHNGDGTVDEFRGEVSPWLWRQICSVQGNCLGRRCVFFARCYYWQARRRTQHANMLVTNHSLLCSDLAARQRGVSLLGKYESAIIDEVDHIEAVAAGFFGMAIRERRVQALLEGLYDAKGRRGLLVGRDCRSSIRSIVSVGNLVTRFFDQFRARPTAAGGHVGAFEGSALALCSALHELAGQLKFVRAECEDEDERFELTAYRDRLIELSKQVEEFAVRHRLGYAYRVETGRGEEGGGVVLRATPLNVSRMLRETLFDRLRCVVLIGGRLSGGQSAGLTAGLWHECCRRAT